MMTQIEDFKMQQPFSGEPIDVLLAVLLLLAACLPTFTLAPR